MAEQLATEVVFRASRSLGAPPDPETRVYRIATDLALRDLPASPRSVPAFADAAGVVAGMPPQQRAAVLLHKYHHLDFRQISEVLDCSESAAQRLLVSAYDVLRGRLVAA